MEINKFKNKTHTQHFVSQCEQRLNSCSETLIPKNAKIYSYEILDKNLSKIGLLGKKTIENTLKCEDLFTMTRLEKKERINLERLFQRYEGNHLEKVENLLEKIARAKNTNPEEKIELNEALDDIKFIYKYKTMNWIRNPYKIKEIIRIFSPFLSTSIASPTALKLCSLIFSKNDAELKYISSLYGVSTEEYRDWIRLIILFIYFEKDEEETILDGYIKEFFFAKELMTNVVAFYYDNNSPLLPDIAIVRDTDEDASIYFYMNISKNCFIALQHQKIKTTLFNEFVKNKNLPAESVNQLITTMATRVRTTLYINDLETLAGYNKICIKASNSQVFSASSSVHGITIV